jgi:Sigma-70, region 4
MIYRRRESKGVGLSDRLSKPEPGGGSCRGFICLARERQHRSSPLEQGVKNRMNINRNLHRRVLVPPGAPPSARSVIEASVHLPRRGRIWVATYRDGSGRQFWKSTGQTDRQAAWLIAQELERAAREQRASQVDPLRQSSGRTNAGQFTQREIGLLMGISERAVRAILKRALRKLAAHPALRDIWREWTGNVEEAAIPTGGESPLSEPEIAAVYALARTPAELNVLRKLIAILPSANQ